AAVAVAVEYRGREVVAGAGGGAAQARASGQVAMAAGGRTQVQARLWSAVGAPQLDYATGGIAVERRERAAHDLDAVAGGEGEVRDLALAVRCGGRDAVGIQAHAAHAEGRARAEAADRQLGVLRAVLAVARQQP